MAVAVKNTCDSHRWTTLVEELQGVADMFVGKFRLPLNPLLLVKSVNIEVQAWILVRVFCCCCCCFYCCYCFNIVKLEILVVNIDSYPELLLLDLNLDLSYFSCCLCNSFVSMQSCSFFNSNTVPLRSCPLPMLILYQC